MPKPRFAASEVLRRNLLIRGGLPSLILVPRPLCEQSEGIIQYKVPYMPFLFMPPLLLSSPMCQQSDPFVIVEEVVWRCETRYCCDGACQCASMTLTEEPCMVSPPM